MQSLRSRVVPLSVLTFVAMITAVPALAQKGELGGSPPAQLPNDATAPPSDATALSPSDATAPPPSNATALPPSDATAPPPSNATGPPPSNATALPPSNAAAPPTSNAAASSPASLPVPPPGEPKRAEAGAPTKSAYVISRLNLRQGPGVENPIVTVIPGGSAVRVAGCDNGWCSVEWHAQSGYAIATGLEIGRVRHVGEYGPPPALHGEPVYGSGPVYYGPPPGYYYGPPAYYYGPGYYYWGPRWGYRHW
jgi:hypothetical protein